ncbi:MAG: hypothetical protein HND52_15480 [Ignavibacteriae bacterium]|nr:hypothetical protein [Ignavibacteriota bacterium]NOG99357.1 hypothetical protein [Ignavibacteriota bacterium]
MNLKFKQILILLLISIMIGCDRDSINTPLKDDGVPPNPPSGLNVWRARDGQVGIEWFRNTEAGTKGYNIYRSINDTIKFMLLAYTNDDFFLDTGLEYDSTYYYKLTSIDIFDNEGKFSPTVFAKPENYFKPITPFDSRINARNWNDSIYIYLSWVPTGDTDIKQYNIYRDTIPNFEIAAEKLHDSTYQINYSDTSNIQLLIKYYYKVTAVDKGNLQSEPTRELTDIIFNKPKIIFPENNAEISFLSALEIELISEPADYKIVIQKNEFFDIIREINFSTDEVDVNRTIPISNIVLESYRYYYWRVITYSNSSSEPNSFTDINNFKIVPQNIEE